MGTADREAELEIENDRLKTQLNACRDDRRHITAELDKASDEANALHMKISTLLNRLKRLEE